MLLRIFNLPQVPVSKPRYSNMGMEYGYFDISFWAVIMEHFNETDV